MKREENISFFTIAIKNLLVKFHANPFYFFYEEDVKTYLLSQLSNMFDEEEFSVRHDFVNKLSVSKIKSIPIKSEYPYVRGKISKYDISLIEAIGDNHYDLPSSIVIELKLGSAIYDRCSNFKDDLRKLIFYRNNAETNNSLGISLFLNQSSLTEKEIKSWLMDFHFIISEIRNEDLVYLILS